MSNPTHPERPMSATSRYWVYELDPESIEWLKHQFGAKRVSYGIQKAIDEMKARYSSVACDSVQVQGID